MKAAFTQTDRSGRAVRGELTLKQPGKIRFEINGGDFYSGRTSVHHDAYRRPVRLSENIHSKQASKCVHGFAFIFSSTSKKSG